MLNGPKSNLPLLTARFVINTTKEERVSSSQTVDKVALGNNCFSELFFFQSMILMDFDDN